MDNTSLESYVASRQGLAWSQGSIERYTKALTQFLDWLGDRADACTYTAADVRAYQAVLARRGGAARSIALALSAIRSFSRWLVEQGARVDDPTVNVRWPKLPKTAHRALSSDQLAHLHGAIAQAPVNRRDLRLWQRNRRCIYLCLYAGLRIGEVADLCWEHIDLARGVLQVVDGKGHKPRDLPLHPTLQAELERVPVHRRAGAVCGHWDDMPVGVAALQHIFDRWLIARGGPDITAHQLRHTCATELRRRGADLKDIQDVLGHESLATTEIYLGPDPERLREAINRLPAPDVEVRRSPARLKLVK